MHRQFAGILATAAFAITVIRGWAASADAAVVLPRAAVAMAAFAVLGAALGRTALWMVEEGVAAQLRSAMNEQSSRKV